MTDLARRLEGVEGWLHRDEARALHDAVIAVGGRPTVVEIGSWKGRSTIALASAVQRLGGGTVVAIDPHTGNVEHHARWGAVDTYQEFLANLGRAGVTDVVRPVRAPAHQARAGFDDPVDVLFVDGSHEYDDVRQDLDDWLPLVSPGGVVVVNDTSWPGVHRAVRERLLGRRSPWRRGRLLRSTLFLDHLPGERWRPADDLRLAALTAALAARRGGDRVRAWLPAPVKAAGNRLTSWLTRA